ncbi:MAG: hypothetical protein JW720_01045 [Sedimentisphaerales bacterium]|nr:hypothetical protein [Sedimentisphaerales bacterium]
MSELWVDTVFSVVLLRSDDGGWMQLLVFVVVLAFSGLSALVKTRKRRQDVEESEAESGPIPPRRPQATQPIAPGAAREAVRRGQPRSIIRPGSTLSAFVAEIKKEILQTHQGMQTDRPHVQRPIMVEPEAKEPPKPATTTDSKAVHRSTPEPQEDILTDLLPDFSSGEDLRRAIICYEVLGKCVALRSCEEQIIR